jgi:predicted PurR-regulated permease PerM
MEETSSFRPLNAFGNLFASGKGTNSKRRKGPDMKGYLNTTALFQLLMVLLLVAWCFLIVQPFLLLITWAVLLAVTLFPLYRKWVNWFGLARKGWATLWFVMAMALVLLVPLYYMTGAIVDASRGVVGQLREDALHIPKPDPSLADWPIVGERIYSEWRDLSESVKTYALKHKEVLLEKAGPVLEGLTSFFGSLALFVISFFLSVFFMYHSERGHRGAQLFLTKLVGPGAEEMVVLSRDTIRSVFKGILLVAFIQALLALIGFELAGIPRAGLFALAVLVLAIVQVPVLLIMIPPIVMGISSLETLPAVLFSVYLIAVALSENLLKPVLMNKGLHTPVIIIMIGSLGGMLFHGIVGLFVGPVILAVAHRLLLLWVQSPEGAAKVQAKGKEA